MEKVKKLHEKKRMGGRRLSEDEEDHKATLWYDLEKETKKIFEEVTRKKQTVTTLGHFARKLWAIERKYKEAGLSREEIEEIREDIINGKN